MDCPNNVGDAVYLIGTDVFVAHRLSSSIKEARLALDAVCPPLPSADNVTRDVMEQLQKQMTLLRNGQQQSLDSLGKSQATLAKLGTNLQLAFQKSIREQLAPRWKRFLSWLVTHNKPISVT